MDKIIKLSTALLLLLPISCTHVPEVPEPPTAPSEVFPDCSYSFTEAVQDTNSGISTTEEQIVFYEGFSVGDISFNPKNPNQLAFGLSASESLPQINISGTNVAALAVVDLCIGETEVIYQSNTEWMGPIHWGPNGKILFGGYNVNDGHVYHINADGTDLSAVNGSFHLIYDLLWCPDGQSFLISDQESLGFVNAKEYSSDGTIEDDDIGIQSFGALDYLPNGHVAYRLMDVGVFDRATQSTTIIDQNVPPPGSNPGIAYVDTSESLLWSCDSMVGLTNIETGQQTPLSFGNSTSLRRLRGAASSANGYLTYVAQVASTSLSQNSPTVYYRTEIRFINPDGTDERRLVLDFN